MSIYVNDNGTWKLSKDVYVDNAGTWIEPQEVYFKNSSTWTLLHKVVTFNTDQYNINLFTYCGSPTGRIRLKVYINSGVNIASGNTSTPSFIVNGLYIEYLISSTKFSVTS